MIRVVPALGILDTLPLVAVVALPVGGGQWRVVDLIRVSAPGQGAAENLEVSCGPVG